MDIHNFYEKKKVGVNHDIHSMIDLKGRRMFLNYINKLSVYTNQGIWTDLYNWTCLQMKEILRKTCDQVINSL